MSFPAFLLHQGGSSWEALVAWEVARWVITAQVSGARSQQQLRTIFMAKAHNSQAAPGTQWSVEWRPWEMRAHCRITLPTPALGFTVLWGHHGVQLTLRLRGERTGENEEGKAMTMQAHHGSPGPRDRGPSHQGRNSCWRPFSRPKPLTHGRQITSN